MSESIMQLKKDFVFRLSQFIINKGQFTIVEDLPATKPIRMENKKTLKPSPRTGQFGTYEVYLIKIAADGYEANLEMFKTELTHLAIAFPDGLSNYKGVTLAHDGSHWVYVCGGNGDPSFQPNAQNTPKSPVNAPGQQNTTQIDGLYLKLAQAVTLCQTIGQKTTKDNVIQVARNIVAPGQDVEAFVQAAKMAGWLVERDGVYSGTA